MIKVLSHACLEIKNQDCNLLIDPWLVGSCYWRSWWNYPPLKPLDFDQLNPDIIYITHVHWDHWHGPTLKKFLNKDVLIITHDEPNKRSVDDLKNFGFKNIKILKHGESFEKGGIKLTPYQFGLFLNDSALVVETKDFKLLNANDCKIAGASLEQIKNRHGKFDFAFRSHSSANDRVCYKIENKDIVMDDALHYSRSFKLFMDNVQPRYAVPFASNHCHLHKNTYHFNKVINDPFDLQKNIETFGGLTGSELKIMLPGDSWFPQTGFNLNPKMKKYFDNKDIRIKEYHDRNIQTLEAYYKLEASQRLTNRTLNLFEKQLASIPKILKSKLKGWHFVIVLINAKKEEHLKINPYESKVKSIPLMEFNESQKAKIIMPLIVFNDAVNKNMFHHSAISKRNRYIFSDKENLLKWELLNEQLGKVELGVYPLKINYIVNFIKSYFRRRRELFVYLKAFLYLQKGMKMYDVEEKILESR